MGRGTVLALVLLGGCVRLGYDAPPGGDVRRGDGAAETSVDLSLIDAVADSLADLAGDAGSDATVPPWTLSLPEDCSAATWPTTASTVKVSPSMSLAGAIQAAGPDTTLLLDPGTHPLPQGALLGTERVILRGTGGDRSKVIIDGQGATTALTISASHVIVADLTIAGAERHAVEVDPAAPTIRGVVLFNLAMKDTRGDFIGTATTSGYADDGVVGCLEMVLTDAHRATLGSSCETVGIDLQAARGWRIYGNRIEGTWCPDVQVGAIQVRAGSRDTVIERNRILDAWAGIRVGIMSDALGSGRTYSDGGCNGPTTGQVDNYGGIIRNNFVAIRAGVKHDSGIMVWNSCDTEVVHNTVFSAVEPFSSIEWRYPNTNATVQNNLVSHTLRERNGASALEQANITGATDGWFKDVGAGDLHLSSAAAAALDKGASLAAGVCTEDIDLQPRGTPPDVGADEL